MNPAILFRMHPDYAGELVECGKRFLTFTTRTELKFIDVVIGRYSVLPFYKETYVDCMAMGAKLINNPYQHQWISDFEWYGDVASAYIPTPQTYFDEDFWRAPEGEYVVKGRTNSRKLWWNKQMFAPNKRRASEIAGDLMGDSLIGPQGVVYRKYVPLKKLGEGLNGLPFTNEWRFFYLGDNLVDYGYYWSNSDCIEEATIDDNVVKLVNSWAKVVSQHTNFFVLDVAQTEAGNWILIEINDAQMSGLSEIPADRFYENLRRVTDDKSRENSWGQFLYRQKSETPDSLT
jgi:hypothetical protein